MQWLKQGLVAACLLVTPTVAWAIDPTAPPTPAKPAAANNAAAKAKPAVAAPQPPGPGPGETRNANTGAGAKKPVNPAPFNQAPDPAIWLSMKNETSFARNFERRQLRDNERFQQVVTVFDSPMTAERRSGREIATGEYLEIFRVGDTNSAVVQIRVDRGSHWLLSRQTFWLRELADRDPGANDQVFSLFQHALEGDIDETRWDLRRFPVG